MPDDSVQIKYNENLKPLEKILKGVKRAGDFFVRGAIEVPLPKIEIEGVGVLSFPVPEEQARKLIQQAERAPYGRGPETVFDTTVRKVWQLSPQKARISGRSWEESFARIISQVAGGLGCAKAKVSAELYKVLIYDKGGFFRAHRDTEKEAGMFGTLVIVLPSFHRGGELVVRHAGREVELDLSSAEVSELTFAAFYADCEHEVRPILEGNRVCLVYNLIQQRANAGAKAALGAPLYDEEAIAAAAILEKTLTETDAPVKLVWLLEHQYTQAELSFATLKNSDAARAKVLTEAATRAGCAVHLGIVHIQESGAAESSYGGYSRGRSRWNRYSEEEDVNDDSRGYDEDFEIVEVYDASQHIDHWIDCANRKAGFGPVPLAESELLPQGALDNEKPDEQRYMEASGNEGASFERAYNRAAVVIWRLERFAEVLLQAGVGAVVPYLKQRVTDGAAAGSAESQKSVRELAALVLERWKPTPEFSYLCHDAKAPDRAEMLGILCELGDAALLEQFIAEIVTRNYDGTENAALAKAAKLLGPTTSGNLFAHLVEANMAWFHLACVVLLRRLVKLSGGPSAAAWLQALMQIATVTVEKLAEVNQVRLAGEEFEASNFEENWADADDVDEKLDWRREQKLKPVDSTLLVELLEALADLGATQLRETAADTIASRPAVFAPVNVIVPALTALHQKHGESMNTDPVFVRLWHHASGFLLERSECPPKPPPDWRQDVTISCKCEDCRELQRFARDPVRQAHRFPAASGRRQHLHQTIEQYHLDMTHVTERKGRPYTLVCTKTRRGYERRCAEYHQEIAAMAELVPLTPQPIVEALQKAARLTASIARSSGAPPGSAGRKTKSKQPGEA
ncbi:MAG TPA: 2OG-Fe(II) oxygenase [Verrucomicrobiae bacterium]|nr:2OG-Fe(II) oxygenase [Verrucomicrobiae bacterium]